MNGDYVMSTHNAYHEFTGHGPNGGSIGNPQTSVSRTNSNSLNSVSTGTTGMLNTYYIYSFDGKLMAEYDHNGNCVKDYIYMGNRMIAEYHSQTEKYYYQMSDQHNSTRMITDDTGTVVYSAAHSPYGEKQKLGPTPLNPNYRFPLMRVRISCFSFYEN